MENNHHNPENDPSFGFQKDLNPGKRNVFTTPVNYFDKLPLEVADKIHSERNDAGLYRSSVPKLIGFATLIAIVIAGGVLLYNGSNSKKISESVLTYDDLINLEMVTEIDESMIFEAYTESSNLSGNQNQQSVETTELEDYLIENNTDITLIINEL